MKASINEQGERIFAVSEYEWFDRTSFGQKAEELIAWKLAQSFTDEELQKLVKIDMKKVERKAAEIIAKRVVRAYMESKGFKEKE